MVETILSLIGGIKGLVIGIGSLIGGAWLLLMKRKFDKQQETIATQERVIKVHEAKDRTHSNDEAVNQTVESRVNAVREKVDNAAAPDQAAQEVSNAFNDYFGSGK